MSSQLINEDFSVYKYKLIDFLEELHQFTIEVGNEEFQKIISNLRSNINEPFLFGMNSKRLSNISAQTGGNLRKEKGPVHHSSLNVKNDNSPLFIKN